jgi:hypothetical protein
MGRDLGWLRRRRDCVDTDGKRAGMRGKVPRLSLDLPVDYP